MTSLSASSTSLTTTPTERTCLCPTARQIEFCRHQINPKADVMISQVVLTSDQVHEYELPHAPDNPRVELDALEALNPEALDEIVREAIEEWRDEDLQYRWRVS